MKTGHVQMGRIFSVRCQLRWLKALCSTSSKPKEHFENFKMIEQPLNELLIYLLVKLDTQP